jgi:hypothetical protein
MGHLDEQSYAHAIAGCPACDRKAFEVSTYLEREQLVMLGEPSQDGRWIHDQAKLVDGTYRIRCLNCDHETHATPDCPRCGHAGGVADALVSPPRLAVPRMCPGCKSTTLLVVATQPARLRTGDGPPTSPVPIAKFGDVGYHIVAIACEGCDWTAPAGGCPVCGQPT